MAISFRRSYKLKPHDLLAFAEMGVTVVQSPSRRSLLSIRRDSLTSTSTTYASKGAETAPDEIKTELGTQSGGVIPDRVPLFGSRANAIRQYEYMTNDDAAVDVSLRAAKMPILGSDFFIEPASSSAEDDLIREFIDDNLFNRLDCPWLFLLEDVLRFFEHGVTGFEKNFALREWAPNKPGANRKMYTMLESIAPRPTPTLGKFWYDDYGRLSSIDQNALNADGTLRRVNIPVDKLVIFSFNRKGGNLEGKSLLRTAYKHWYYKNNLYTIDGIQKERHGMGFPILTLPPNYSKNDLEAAKELVRNIRTNQEAGAVLPPGFILAFAEMKGQPVDVIKSIDHHNGMIMMNIMVAFLLTSVSESSSGGRASSASAQDMFIKSLRFVGNMICEIMNTYVIPQLVRYNFDTMHYPKMGVRNIGETKDMQQWASAISNLIATNGITMDLPTEQFLRKIADLPLKMGDKQTPEANMGYHLEELEKGIIPGQGNPNGKGGVRPDNQGAGNTPKGTDPAQK